MKEIKHIEELLCFYLNYYQKTRGVGHTITMLNGAKNTECYIITAMCGQSFGKDTLNKLIQTDNVEKLHNSNLPIVFDNYTLQVIFTSALNEIRRCKNKYIRLMETVDEFTKIIKEHVNV